MNIPIYRHKNQQNQSPSIHHPITKLQSHNIYNRCFSFVVISDCIMPFLLCVFLIDKQMEVRVTYKWFTAVRCCQQNTKFISIISKWLTNSPQISLKGCISLNEIFNSAHRIGAHQKLHKKIAASCDISKCNCALHFLAPCIELPYKYSVLLRRLTWNELEQHLFSPALSLPPWSKSVQSLPFISISLFFCHKRWHFSLLLIFLLRDICSKLKTH